VLGVGWLKKERGKDYINPQDEMIGKERKRGKLQVFYRLSCQLEGEREKEKIKRENERKYSPANHSHSLRGKWEIEN